MTIANNFTLSVNTSPRIIVDRRFGEFVRVLMNINCPIMFHMVKARTGDKVCRSFKLATVGRSSSPCRLMTKKGELSAWDGWMQDKLKNTNTARVNLHNQASDDGRENKTFEVTKLLPFSLGGSEGPREAGRVF